MEAMEAISEGKIHISPDLRVYQRWKIPPSTRGMRARRKGPGYMQEMHLYYTGDMFYVNVRLAIDLSLTKLAKWTYDLRHRLAIFTCIAYDVNLHPLLLTRKKLVL